MFFTRRVRIWVQFLVIKNDLLEQRQKYILATYSRSVFLCIYNYILKLIQFNNVKITKSLFCNNLFNRLFSLWVLVPAKFPVVECKIYPVPVQICKNTKIRELAKLIIMRNPTRELIYLQKFTKIQFQNSFIDSDPHHFFTRKFYLGKRY